MEIKESQQPTLIELSKLVLTPETQDGLSRIWEKTENRLRTLTSDEIKRRYAEFGVKLLKQLDFFNDRSPFEEALRKNGVTMIRIGNQDVGVAEKPQGKSDVLLVRATVQRLIPKPS